MNFEKENKGKRVIPAEGAERSFEAEREQTRVAAEELWQKFQNAETDVIASGTDLELKPETVASVLEKNNYRTLLADIRRRFRETVKAAAFALPLAASPAFAEDQGNTAPIQELSGDKAGTDIFFDSEVLPYAVTGGMDLKKTETLGEGGEADVEEIKVEEEKEIPARESLTLKNASEIQSDKKLIEPVGEEVAENEIEKAKREIFKEFGEKRLALFQEFATSLLVKGAGSPETQKKLFTLLGEEMKAGDIPLAVAQNFVPFLHGARLVARAFSGKSGESELSDFERMRSFAFGLGSIAVDASKIGYIGKNVLTAKRIISGVNRAHATLNYATSATEIMQAVQENKSNPYAQEVVGKVVKMLQKKTVIEEGQGALEKKIQEFYDKGLVEVPTFPSAGAE